MIVALFNSAQNVIIKFVRQGILDICRWEHMGWSAKAALFTLRDLSVNPNLLVKKDNVKVPSRLMMDFERIPYHSVWHWKQKCCLEALPSIIIKALNQLDYSTVWRNFLFNKSVKLFWLRNTLSETCSILKWILVLMERSRILVGAQEKNRISKWADKWKGETNPKNS